ncbi:hypothetical protein CPB86DRAFT_180089 [Serendipita vermifera]|nr:hypothetical protein CPB86DRAFT_180089 [Serendipita vermifera]
MAEHVNETRHDGTTPPTAFCTAAPLDCLFVPPYLYQDPVDALFLTQKSELPETQQRGGWCDHAHDVHQQAAYPTVDTAIRAIDKLNLPAPVLENRPSDPPNIAPSPDRRWPNQNSVNAAGVRSTYAATGSAYPQPAALEPFYPVPTGFTAATSNGKSQETEKRPSRMRRASTLQEARQFLVELERKWGPKRSTWFSKKDAEPLHDLLARFQKDERKRIKSLLSYSGNTVESIQTTILRFEERMQNKRGFIGQYDPQSGQDLSLLLEDYLVVKISDRPKYITSSCGRSKCDHCSNNVSGNSNQGGRSWQHVMICLSSSLQGNANVWTCFESECSKSFSSSENLARHRLRHHSEPSN